MEIDYCPRCRGVWLDRAELDKITERASRFMADDDDRRREPERRLDYRNDREHYYKRRKSFWSELFD